MDRLEVAQLKQHWTSLINKSQYDGNLAKLSQDVGRSEAYMRGFLGNSSVPKADVVRDMAKALGVSTDALLGVDEAKKLVEPTSAATLADQLADEFRKIAMQRLAKLDFDLTGKDIMRWWHQTGGRLEAIGAIQDRLDIYHAPQGTDRKIRPYQLGANSLSTRSLGTASDDLFQRTIAPLGDDFADKILVAHESSIDRGPMSSIETLDAEHPNGTGRISIQYIRTLTPVTLPNGSIGVLNFSELIG